MTNAKDPIHFMDSNVKYNEGLTKREYFAARAMQGMLANKSIFNGEIEGNHDAENYDFIGKEAAFIADALIKALNENQ
jgi:hypothetical protein